MSSAEIAFNALDARRLETAGGRTARQCPRFWASLSLDQRLRIPIQRTPVLADYACHDGKLIDALMVAADGKRIDQRQDLRSFEEPLIESAALVKQPVEQLRV